MTEEPSRCYVCQQELISRHSCYSELCPSCGDLNLRHRDELADLTGFTALVTGGRLKIGFETVLKLLRCGARVLLTTRFVDDAKARFLAVADAAVWGHRLSLCPADFRVIASMEAVLDWVRKECDQLDILINNAAQTVRRPPAYYRSLVAGIRVADGRLEVGRERLLESSLLRGSSGSLVARSDVWLGAATVGRLSTFSLLPGDDAHAADVFPEGKRDEDGQQEDRRDFNSWMMRLEEVHPVEFLEVLYINLLAPFLLCSQLKEKMRKRHDERPSFIVNVSAMEGNFYDPEKNYRHPHTNMAKAALNMMTRTAAGAYREERIFMTAVDPGWITNEHPFPLSTPREQRKTRMAIDSRDGAARICDPILRALIDNEYLSGLLLKNYKIFPW